MANVADTRARRLLRGAGLAVAAAAAYWVGSALNGPGSDAPASLDDIVAPAIPARKRVATPAPSPRDEEPWTAASASAAERLRDTAAHNPFASLNVAAPAPPPTAKPPEPKVARQPAKPASATVAPAPPPVAPPLPFTAVGAIEGAQIEQGRRVAFVKQQDQLLLVRAGDTIGQTYRVEAVTPQKIEFIYLPLMQRQTLALSP